jgi:hypothetical protein
MRGRFAAKTTASRNPHCSHNLEQLVMPDRDQVRHASDPVLGGDAFDLCRAVKTVAQHVQKRHSRPISSGMLIVIASAPQMISFAICFPPAQSRRRQ